MNKLILGIGFLLISNLMFAQSEFVEQTYGRAKLDYKLRKLKEASAACDQVIELDTGYYDAYLLKGKILYDQGDYDGALKYVSRSLEIYNRNGEAFFERGLMYYYLDKYQEAADDFTEASKIEIKNADYYYFKGLSLKEVDEMYEACRAWKRAQKLGIDEDIQSLRDENCRNLAKPPKE